MTSSQIKFWNSIVIRFALFFTGLLVFVILLSGYLVFQKSSSVIVDFAKERIRYSSESAEQSFYALLGEVSNDIAVISGSLALQNFVKNPDQTTSTDLSKLFEVILTNKPAYFQIRLIDTSGLEIIRFDKNENTIMQMESQDLQQKGGREYFQEAMKINPGEYYFSKINLNEEYGIISEPPIVTLRAASLVMNQEQKKFGIVIINVDLSSFYDELNRISTAGTHFYLIDSQGQYLYHPEHSKEFGMQRRTGYSFEQDFNFNIFDSTSIAGEYQDKQGNSYLYFVLPLNYFHDQRRVFLISAIDENTLLQSARSVRRESLQSLTLVCLLSLLLSYFFTRLFSKQINQVTEAITRYEGGDRTEEIPIQRNDEIGVLARSFSAMRSKNDQTLNELNEALKEEKKAKIQRDEFLQNMSHELRTPLHAIQGLTQLLRKNKPSEGQIPIIQSMERSVNNLTGLVYDVLDHQKLVEGKLNIHLSLTNIDRLLEDIFSNYQFDAVKKGLQFTKNLNPVFTEQLFMTDPLRLSQIVTNLVVNAIKYTDRGSVSMTADMIPSDPPLLEIVIEDTGVGIMEENLDKINDRFFQERKEISGRYGGYGLGLSIVKQLVILFDGNLMAESKKGKGSRFAATIPIFPVINPERREHDQATIQNLPRLKGNYQILQIDDDASTLEMVSYLLDSNQFQIDQIYQKEDIDNYLRKHAPDLIITDLMMGERDIRSDLEQAKADKLIRCPVIVMSAMDAPYLKEIGNFWFQKPFDLSLLVDRVYQLLGSNEFTTPDFKEIEINYDNNSERIKRVLDLLETEFTLFIERIDYLLETQDLEEWQAVAHKLITHARSLKLSDAEGYLHNTIAVPETEDLKTLQNLLRYTLCCIRLEKATKN